MSTINYNPAPTIRDFIKHHKPGQFFADWVIGPVGSGKTTGIFFKLINLARLQRPSPVDGKRRVRVVVVRNTLPQLQDTTIVSWNLWFKDGQAGKWFATDKRFLLQFGDVEVEVLFRPLDTKDDVDRVLSLEVTFAIIDEFVQIPREIIDQLSARCGRYPSKKDGGPTNWGMWGSSNPGNEDSWWYEALKKADQWTVGVGAHATQEQQVLLNERILEGAALTNWTYFVQPSGFADNAENLENLPGGREYYVALTKDRSVNWVKQYVEVEWGYSLVGSPVIPSFKFELHVAKKPLKWNPLLPLVGGYDPGMNSAMILGQMDHYGRLLVLNELVQRDMGAKRFITNRLQPLLRITYPNADFCVSPDPASGQRTQTDEQTVLQVVRKYYRVRVADSNNRLPGRIEAIEHYTTRLTEQGPALLIDPNRCPTLIRALRSGWHYGISQKGDIQPEPVKNDYSHPGDGFSYLCKYFYKGLGRDERRSSQTPIPRFTNAYVLR
jgi:hypothetical protein